MCMFVVLVMQMHFKQRTICELICKRTCLHPCVRQEKTSPLNMHLCTCALSFEASVSYLHLYLCTNACLSQAKARSHMPFAYHRHFVTLLYATASKRVAVNTPLSLCHHVPCAGASQQIRFLHYLWVFFRALSGFIPCELRSLFSVCTSRCSLVIFVCNKFMFPQTIAHRISDCAHLVACASGNSH